MSADAANLADLRRLGVSETLDWWFRDRKRKPHNFNGLCRTLETLLGFADKFTGEHIFPSFAEVSRITGASYRTTQRHVQTLERLGVLRKLKSFISNLRLPYEFSVSRGFALRLLRRHLETAKGWIKIRISNSLKLLERTSPEGATSLQWRRRNPIARTKDAPAPQTAVSGVLIPAKGGIGQIDSLPPALRAGDQGSGVPDAFGAGTSPLSSRSGGAPAGASPVPKLIQVLDLLKSFPQRR